jgi:hypothetical protein
MAVEANHRRDLFEGQAEHVRERSFFRSASPAHCSMKISFGFVEVPLLPACVLTSGFCPIQHRDLRDTRTPAGPQETAALETYVKAGLILARAAPLPSSPPHSSQAWASR